MGHAPVSVAEWSHDRSPLRRAVACVGASDRELAHTADAILMEGAVQEGLTEVGTKLFSIPGVRALERPMW